MNAVREESPFANRGAMKSPWRVTTCCSTAFDLRGYDLVVSSESGPAKGVITSSNTRHLCYCHTPMRYLWDLYPAYRNEWTRSSWKRAAMTPLSSYLRLRDFAGAARVDRSIANSENVRGRIWKIYRRDAEVVHPPVDVDRFEWKPAEDYFLVVSELVPYKQVDIAVQLFAKTGRRLKIAGSGPELGRLRKMAAPNVELASGKPVMALGRGGALETVPPRGGIFYDDASAEGLAEALQRFEKLEPEIRPAELQEHVRRFSEPEFARKIAAALEELLRGGR